ncbi:MAG: alcohol dehydrogenase catalytic domain-containing protein [Desulfurococcales archaeon]|nr:alcohol dehydrogenase catalytic domain-containing protein [Desulfurococcales archaeon]
MKAAVLFGPRDLRLVEVDTPRPPAGWALIEAKAVGICGTDKAFYTGSYPLFKTPLIPGHEVSGVVVEGPSELLGERVVSEINFACRQCRVCQAGLYTHCPNRRTLGIDFDGGMAEYFIAPTWALHRHRLPHDIAFAAEPLAAVVNMVRQRPPEPGDLIGVIGSGFISWLTANLLRMLGHDPVIIVRRGSMKANLFERAGFRVVQVEEASRLGREESSLGLGFDYIVEATGSNSGLRAAVELVRPRGVIHLKSTPGGVASFPQTVSVVKEVRVIGTRCGDWRDFKLALSILSRSLVSVPVTARYPLDEVDKAFAKSLEGDSFRVVVTP